GRIHFDKDTFKIIKDGKEIDIAECIEATIFEGEATIRVILQDSEGAKARIGDVARALLGTGMDELEIRRTALYMRAKDKRGWIEPL
ncbi:MAG: hypothetical protein L0Y62_06025, partial [Nitrospirae bacterium]|nr:hypothetical protein [Nitrospirota bacterium]